MTEARTKLAAACTENMVEVTSVVPLTKHAHIYENDSLLTMTFGPLLTDMHLCQ